MAARLEEFLSGYIDRPFEWGRDDCSLFLADWWQFNHGIDPAAHLRGTYDCEGQKDVVVARHGGILRLVSGIADSVGAQRCFSPAFGAFGIIEPGVGGIYAGDFWAFRTWDGVGFSKEAKPWRIWSI